MTELLRRFPAWARDSDLKAADLARYRILYAGLALLLLPDFTFLADFPDAWYSPPPGPFALLTGFPPAWFMTGLELVLIGALLCLLIGWHTRIAGITTGVAMIIGFGLTYSLGKIDHNILLVLVPLVFSFSSWGAALSVDAVRGRGGSPSAGAWVPRYFALVVGLSLLTAALQKAVTGWLDPGSQATLGHMARNLLLQGRDAWLAEPFITITWTPLWESVDVATVIIEAVVVVAVLNWRAFRTSLALVALFHVSVLLMLNIPFVANVIAYGAFVTWSRVGKSAPELSPGFVRVLPWAVLPLAVGWFFAAPYVVDAVGLGIESAVIFVGGAVGIYYLLVQARALAAARSLRTS